MHYLNLKLSAAQPPETTDPFSLIVIHEVRADAWGYQGVTQEYRYIDGRGR